MINAEKTEFEKIKPSTNLLNFGSCSLSTANICLLPLLLGYLASGLHETWIGPPIASGENYNSRLCSDMNEHVAATQSKKSGLCPTMDKPCAPARKPQKRTLLRHG
jgi:hypothetical protein